MRIQIFLIVLFLGSVIGMQDSNADLGSWPWPKTNLDLPSQALIGQPFEATLSYSFVEFNEDGTVADISEEDRNSPGVHLLIEIPDGVKIISASGFELSEKRINRYNVTVYDYRKTNPFDNSKIFNESFTFQVNEPMRFPYNRIAVWADGSHQIRYLDYQDNVVTFHNKEVYPYVGKELQSIPFQGVSVPLTEEQQRNPALIDSMAEFLSDYISVSNMTEFLQNDGISNIIIEELISRHPELFESSNNISTVTLSVLTPKKQIENGIPPEEVDCKNGLEMVFRISDNSPACVKPESIPKLIERGWAKNMNYEIPSNTQTEQKESFTVRTWTSSFGKYSDITTITPEKIVFSKSEIFRSEEEIIVVDSPDAEPIEHPISIQEWMKLERQINFPNFNLLPDTIGNCLGCLDSPIVWIEISNSTTTKKIRFETEEHIPEITDLRNSIHEIIQNTKNSLTNDKMEFEN